MTTADTHGRAAKRGDQEDAGTAATSPGGDRGSPLILITGGSRGVGAATARLAAKRGYDVAFSYLSNQAAAEAVVADIESEGEGRHALAIQADSADPAQVSQLFVAVDRRFGRLDVLVNNAAVIAHHSRLEDLAFERVLRLFTVNAIGPILCAQQAVKRMSHRHGRARRRRDQRFVGLRPPRQPQRICGLRFHEGRGRDDDDRISQGGRT